MTIDFNEAFADGAFNVTEEDVKSANEGYQPIPAGDYPASIESAEIVKVKSGDNAGKPMYKIQYKVADHEYKGRRVFQNVTAFPNKDGKTPFNLIQLVKATGVGSIKDGQLTPPNPLDLMGEEVTISVTVKTGTYSGNDVRRISAPGGAKSNNTTVEF